MGLPSDGPAASFNFNPFASYLKDVVLASVAKSYLHAYSLGRHLTPCLKNEFQLSTYSHMNHSSQNEQFLLA